MKAEEGGAAGDGGEKERWNRDGDKRGRRVEERERPTIFSFTAADPHRGLKIFSLEKGGGFNKTAVWFSPSFSCQFEESFIIGRWMR